MFAVGTLVVDATRRHAMSALPDAPVAEDADGMPARARVTLAAVLRGVAAGAGSVAERLDPRHRNPSLAVQD
jgi:hypothetical protein